MVRARAFDPASTLSQVVDLFSSKGYSDTSMEDIVQATGVSRYGIYGTFGNKRELFEQALEQYAESMGKKSFLRLLEPGASLQHIRAIFQERVDDLCGDEALRGRDREYKGCLFVHTAMELAPQDEELRGVLQRFMKRISKAFSIGLDSAKGRGEIREDVDVDALSAKVKRAFELITFCRERITATELEIDQIVAGAPDSARDGDE